jgi:hypothetical protein
MDDKYNPRDKSSKEKAEGSRENVNRDPEDFDVDPKDVNAGSATDSPMERGSGQLSQPHRPLPSKGGEGAAGSAGGSTQRSAGITNRPVEEEQQSQEDLTPRGKGDGQD